MDFFAVFDFSITWVIIYGAFLSFSLSMGVIWVLVTGPGFGWEVRFMGWENMYRYEDMLIDSNELGQFIHDCMSRRQFYLISSVAAGC